MPRRFKAHPFSPLGNNSLLLVCTDSLLLRVDLYNASMLFQLTNVQVELLIAILCREMSPPKL